MLMGFTQDAIKMSRRRALAGAAALMLPLNAVEAKFPEKPVMFLCPLPAGGLLDTHMRFLAERVASTVGQPVLVDCKPGATATLAAANIVHSRPDGHALATMMVTSLRYPYYNDTPWHPLRDFTYIIGLSNVVVGIVVRADSPWQTINDLIEAGRKQPEKLNFGTSGLGGTGHLLAIDIETTTGARFTHIPFKGGPETIASVLGGHIDFMCDGAAWAPAVDSGKLRLLALATEQRTRRYLDIPTLRERGIDAVGWSPYGVVGPKGMPDDVVSAVHDAFKKAMDSPDHAALLDRFVQEEWYRSPADYRAWAEDYYASVKPSLIRAGLAKG
jgi:tripartite-type tricarboxylate transporter receptor subunit TctC